MILANSSRRMKLKPFTSKMFLFHSHAWSLVRITQITLQTTQQVSVVTTEGVLIILNFLVHCYSRQARVHHTQNSSWRRSKPPSLRVTRVGYPLVLGAWLNGAKWKHCSSSGDFSPSSSFSVPGCPNFCHPWATLVEELSWATH